MEQHTNIPPAANVLGTIGTVCGVSKIYHNWRRRSTEGLPASMLFLWAACCVPFGTYAIVQNLNIPIQLQPQIFGVLCLICWAQTLLYGSNWRKFTATMLAAGTGGSFAVLEVSIVIAFRRLYDKGITWPTMAIGITAAVMLALGLLPPYYELWKRHGRVVGFSFIFLTIDILGAVFSLMALVAQRRFDLLGGILYIICILLEIGIILSHVIWLFRTRKVRSEAKAANLPMDEYIQKNFARDRMRRKKKNTDIEMINATVTRPARTLEKRTNPPTSSIPAQYDFGKHNSIHVVTRTEPTLSKE